PDGLGTFVFWMISMFVLITASVIGYIVNENEILVFILAILLPFTITFYTVSFYYFIPKLLTKKRPFRTYLLRVMLLLLLSFFPLVFISILFIPNEDNAFSLLFLNAFFQLFITMPVTWILVKKQISNSETVQVLQQELGQTHANFDFLRSQINPHFLFNTLNTLYGTALQEKSERTAQGIQMLGDMMRFMLHENVQKTIPLSREIEYMHNYIELQSLRVSASPDIAIQANLAEAPAGKSIAPMLLIPFVENAFKHGISLKEKSWIKISLQYDHNKLFLDVYNSTHPKQEQDPEKDRAGVGLENVKQRLQLLYPDKHELTIRQTTDEFFVHLTLQL
ncbi:MAG: histidine kinase, partial [Hymenobacteraceae bacterium]|nr:histidine kinase [Hymenobacteraceae bacterium]MDX5396352.1 histidine kinase [Hymenobacteraceae bacterium]MDX5512413.1 histidine kinase [Hymenobacteraceae bacterium]